MVIIKIINFINLYLINVFDKKINKYILAKECKNQCLKDRKRPFERMFNWWKENGTDFESTLCLLDAALDAALENNSKK